MGRLSAAHIHTWISEWMVEEIACCLIFDASSAEIIVLVNLQAFEEKMWAPLSEYPASKC